MLSPIERNARAPVLPGALRVSAEKGRFSDVLHSQLQSGGPLKLSGHAQQRLQHRDISLSQEEMKSVEAAVKQLADRGGREALVLLPRAALLVNVPNRTIITAMPSADMQSSVFTNIDSAVVVPSTSARDTNSL